MQTARPAPESAPQTRTRLQVMSDLDGRERKAVTASLTLCAAAIVLAAAGQIPPAEVAGIAAAASAAAALALRILALLGR